MDENVKKTYEYVKNGKKMYTEAQKFFGDSGTPNDVVINSNDRLTPSLLSIIMLTHSLELKCPLFRKRPMRWWLLPTMSKILPTTFQPTLKPLITQLLKKQLMMFKKILNLWLVFKVLNLKLHDPWTGQQDLTCQGWSKLKHKWILIDSLK